MADIRFHIPKGHIIPLRLALYVDDEYITYEKVHDGYIFYTNIKDKDKALDTVKEVVRKIKEENDESEHGVTWRTISLDVADIDRTARDYIGEIVIWYYRIRDSY